MAVFLIASLFGCFALAAPGAGFHGQTKGAKFHATSVTSTTSTAAMLTAAALAVATSTSVCAQYGSDTIGTYILYNDLWGEASATSGSQCSEIEGLSGSTVTWETSWTWAGGTSSVKSYAQIQDGAPTDYVQLADISSYTTEWSWSYSGDNIVADVSYDTFTCSDATSGCTDYEVMVWLAAIGGAGPISSTGSPISTPTIGGYEWKLYSGPNGAMTVYSFVAPSEITSFSGDIMDFYNYLIDSEDFPSTQYLKTISAGTETFTGSDAVFSASYSCSRTVS